MTLPRNKIIALSGTIFFHLLLVVYLLLFGLGQPIPMEEEKGLFVNFGTVDEASGLFEPTAEASTQAETMVEPAPDLTDDLITQDMEESVALATKKKEEARKKLEAEQQRKASEIRSQTASVFSRSSGQTGSQGTSTTDIGNQGSPTGSPASTNTTGGGQGYGDFSLNGRSTVGALPRPSYTIQEEGVVVVQIVVNPKGSVATAAIRLQGTNTDNATLRAAALNAARQARFNTISGTQNQTGTITYHFKLR